MLRIFLVALMLFLIPVVSACAAPPVTPAKQNQIAPNPSSPSVPPAPPPMASMNGITRAAANAGVRTCLERIEQTGNFITANTQSRAILFLPPADADRQVTSASYEVLLPNKAIAYASMSAAPTIAGGCDALYETVTYWTNSCTDVAKKGFPNAKPVGVLQQHITVLQGNANLRIFLMPAGTQGCVAIKKEVVY